jgi:hypothetical protein
MMQSVAEHQEVSKDYAIVKAVKGWKKQHRGWKLAIGRPGGPKELIRGICGSWRKLAAACRKMTHRSGVAWLRRGVIRKDCTRAKVERATQRIRPLRKNLWTHHEGKRGTKDQGRKWPLYVRKKRATTIGIGGWSSRQLSPLGRRGLAYMTH